MRSLSACGQIWGIGGYSLNKHRPFVRKRALLAINWPYDDGDVLYYRNDIQEVKRELKDLVEETVPIGYNLIMSENLLILEKITVSSISTFI